MTTIAQLGFEINSQPAAQAADDLDKLVDSGKGAEDSAKRVESAWQKAVSGISSDTSQIVKELQQLNARQDATAQAMLKLAQAASQTGTALSGTVAAAEKVSAAETKVAESAEQAKARMLALATAAVEASKGQQQLSGAYDTTTAAAGALARQQLDQIANQNRVARLAAESAAAQEKSASSTQKASAATAEDANALAKLIGQIDPTVAALKKLDAQQDLLSKSKELGLLSKTDFEKYSTGIDRAREGLTKFDDGIKKTGVSSAQTQAALRQLPAQFSDIFTSLAGGQNPLLVLIQQGGQIKDSFGGVGPTLDALGGKLRSFFGLSDSAASLTGSLKDIGVGAKAAADGADAAGESLGGMAEGANTAAEASKNAKEAAGALGLTGAPVSVGLGLIVGASVAAAAAVAALVVAYKQGSDEASAYTKALILTGNTAGTSADELASIAKSVSAVNGTVHEAAATLALLAASTKIPVDSFQLIATAAANMEDATGKAASDTVAEFSKIADDPVAAILKLNESMNFLTATTYSQIKSLQQQGETVQAATLATNTYAEAINSRSGKIADNLGLIEKAWKNLGDAAKIAWDTALGVGRKDPAGPDLGALQKELAYKSSLLGTGYEDDTTKDRIAYLQKEIAVIQKRTEAEQASVRAEGDMRQAQQQSVADQVKLDKLRDETASQALKRSKELAEYQALVQRRQVEAEKLGNKDLIVSAEQQAKDIAAIKDKYKDAKVSAPAVDLTGFSNAENALKSLEATYQNSVRILDESLKYGLVTQEQYTLQKSALIDKEKTDVEAAYGAEITALEAVRDKSTTTGAQRIGIDQKIADARQKQTDALKKLDADQDVLSKQTKGRLEQEEAAYKAFAQTVSDSLALAQRGLDQQLAGFGLGELARQQLQQDLQIREDYQRKLEQLTRDYQKIVNPTEGQTSNFERETQLLQSALDERLAKQQKYYQDEATLRSDWMNGASRAFANYIDETKDVAGQTEGLFSDALHGVEDAFVNAATTGKLSFKDLADSIIADLARIVAKAYIVTPILAALGIGGDSATSSTGVIGSVFGGSGSGIGGMLSSIKDVVSVAGSNFGKAIISGFNSGDGILSGLQNAFTSGADYLGTTITSAFSAGSASATAASNFAASSAAGASQAGYTGAAYSSYVSSANAASSLSALGTTLSYIGAVYSVIQSYQAYGTKGAATTAGFAAAGAAIGSVVPVVGTALGAAIGAVIGSFVSSKAFGSGEKYPDLSTSGQGTYDPNKGYVSGGIVKNWQTKAPKYGEAADLAMDSTVNKFTTTLGNLYKAFGVSAQVYAYDLLQVRKTSGKYSNSFGATLDGTGIGPEFNQQFKAKDIAEAMAESYDNVMGTFLAKAIVSSKSLPDYFKAQFTEFADDWDTTADEVIKAIEGVFTRFNGVNDALTLINVNNLKLDNTGLMASDSILNMIGAMSDLDTTTATAKEKVDALNKAVGTYYQAFFSADEQFADLTKSLKGAFAGFGLELPDTRSAYRDMVEDIDVTTAAGQAMFATLVGLATNADSYYSTLEQKAKDAAQKIIDGLMGNVTSAQSALERAINAQKASISDMLQTANTNVSDLTGVSNDLGSALKSLRGESGSAVQMLRAQAQATLQSALAQARAGKSLAGFTGLSDALDTISNNSTDLYSSLEDFNRDQGRTANVVAELEKLNGKQLTNAEQTVKTLQSQLDALDDQLEFAQQQLDALNGVDNSVKTVAQAVKEMNIAVVAALSAITGKASGGTAANNGTLIDSVYQSVLGHGADQAGKDYWLGQLANGSISYSQLEQAIKNAALANGSLQAHANGGYISGPGTGTSDSILARLSNGEYVMKAAAVDAYGTDLLDRMNNLQMPKFASGGAVMNVASPVVAASPQRAQAGNDAGDAAEVIRQLNKRLSNIETYMDSASRDLRQINNAGVQVVGTVSTKELT
jgi:lambda family phage tail tape measure protein